MSGCSGHLVPMRAGEKGAFSRGGEDGGGTRGPSAARLRYRRWAGGGDQEGTGTGTGCGGAPGRGGSAAAEGSPAPADAAAGCRRAPRHPQPLRIYFIYIYI